MPDTNPYGGFVQGLRLAMYIGAARADATPEQLAALRREVLPRLTHYRATGDEEALRGAICTAMGKDWKPTGQWAQFIRNLGGEL